MSEYDESLTLEGKIACDFAHAFIAGNRNSINNMIVASEREYVAYQACLLAKEMMVELRKNNMIIEKVVK